MYSVSSDYLNHIGDNGRTVAWYGTIALEDGETVYNFDYSNMAADNFSVTMQVCSGDDLEIGSTGSAELNLTLVLDEDDGTYYLDGQEVDRYALYNAVVTLNFRLYIDVDNDEYEDVPVGVFNVTEPTRTKKKLTLDCFDNMIFFNGDYDDFGVTGTPYVLLYNLCTLCGVTLGSTKSEIEAMVNGTRTIEVSSLASFSTYRELLGQIAAVLDCNAVIGRDGYLYLKPYSMTLTRQIDTDFRYSLDVADYETYYTQISAYDLEEATIIYSGDSTDGLCYELGQNGLIQSQISAALAEIIGELEEIVYTPFEASLIGDPALECMDVLEFVSDHAESGKYAAITSITYGYGAMTVKCSGGNPKVTAAKDATSSALSNIIKKVSENTFYSYYFENESVLTVSDASTMVASIAVQTIKETKLTLIYTVQFNSGAKGRYYLYFYVNGELYKTYHDAYLDGDNTETVHFTFNVVSAQINYVYVYMVSGGYSTFTIDGTWDAVLDYTWEQLSGLTWEEAATSGTYSDSTPTLTIPIGYSQLTVFGRGLAATEAWDGTITCYDTIEGLTIDDIIGDLTDSVDLDTVSDSTSSLSESLSGLTADAVGDLTETITLADSLLYYSPYITTSNVSTSGITTTSGVWYGSGEIDDGDEGTITIGDEIYTSGITAISADDSGGYWQLSFDSGSTWIGYSDSVWSSSTMMTATQMAALTNALLVAEGSTVQIKCYLEDGCTVRGITVTGGSL